MYSESDRSDGPQRHRIASGVWLLVVATVALAAYMLGRSGWPEWPNTSTAVSAEPAAEPSAEETALDATTSTASVMVATTTTPTAEVASEVMVATTTTPIAEVASEVTSAMDRLEAQEQAWLDQQVDPAVQDQAMQLVLGIVGSHTDSWPWIVSALGRGDLMFFESLPEPCQGSAACVLRRGGAVEKVWFTLDALRLESDFFNRVGAEGIVLHELAHLYDSPAKDSLRDRFAEHYVGCRVRGEEGHELAEELLADAIAVAVLQLDAFERSGFGRYAGPFQGCLRDNDEPPPELIEAIYAALFDCTTLQPDDHINSGFSLASGRWGDYAGEGVRRACGAPEPTAQDLINHQLGLE